MAKLEQNSKGIEKWLTLIRADGVGSVTFQKLLTHFGSIDNALGTESVHLKKVSGIGQKTADSICRSIGKFDIEKELALAEKLGVWLITLEDERYPAALKNIVDRPVVLYVKGTLVREDNLAVAIVGSRKCSLYGATQAGRFGHLLASAGFTICSGLAAGIDTAAHQGALAGQGRTIAVTGCGLGNVFPAENKKLFERIAESGACISELPLTTEPKSENFPPRNRIIAGLSLGAIIVEAHLRSGALITAQAAMDYNRQVMAVPGKIDSPLAKGTNKLIKDGASLIESIEDVMDALGYITNDITPHASAIADDIESKINEPLFAAEQLNLSEHEQVIFNFLSNDPLHVEQIIAHTEKTAGDVNAALISLRLKGLIKQLPGNCFQRN